jgi:hypothetical protein
VNGIINSNDNIRTSAIGAGFIHNDGTINLQSWVNNGSITGTAFFGTSTNHSLALQTNNTGRLYITNTGNIGIGMSNPGCISDINGGTFRVRSGIVNSPTTGTGIEITYSSTNDIGYIYSYDRSLSTYKTLNLNDKVTILGSGNVGIDITSPSYQLELASGGSGIAANVINVNRTTNGEGVIITNGTVRAVLSVQAATSHIGTTTNHNFNLQSNSVNVLQCLTSGNVNIINGLQLNGTLITSTAAELNYNDITTIGVAEANKALIVDSNRDIQSIRRLHISNNISIGTLDFSGTTRLIGAIDNSVGNGGNRYLCLGKSYSTFNEAEWGYFHTPDGSTSNRQEFGFFGANGIFAITAGRKIGINNINPSSDLDISGDIRVSCKYLLNSTSSTALTGITTAQNYGLCLFTNNNTNGYNIANSIAFLNNSTDTIPNATIYSERISVTDGDLILGTRSATYNMSEVLRCRNAGNVLINCSKSQANQGSLTVNGFTNFMDGSYYITYSSYSMDGTNNIQIQQQNGADGFMGTRSNHKFALMSNNTRAITIDINQRVGIGNSSPVGQLQVQRAGTIARFTYFFWNL